MSEQTHTEQLPPKRTWILCLTILCLIFVPNLVSVAHVPILVRTSGAAAGDRVAELEQRIDPNTAPWWELAQLPGIGEITAKRIVAHRQSIGPNAFRQLADLDPIKRIGPITLAKISPFLRFPKSSPAS